MGLSDFLQRDEPGTNIADQSAIVARYQHLRSVTRNLSQRLVERLSKDALDEGGKKLGFLRGGTFVFDSADETSILMDYCMYDVRRKGRNAVEQYLIDSAPDPASDEMACLRAMQRAVYSLFVVESAIRGFGVNARNAISNEPLVIVDIGFGSSAKPGLVLASRLFFHEGFAMTGGAALPIGMPPENERQSLVKMLVQAAAPDDKGHFDPAPLIRACLQHGGSSQIQYQESTGQLAGPRPAPRSIRSERGNFPCPCGSGRKFKNCCMKR